jgi:hypothetical protein
VPAQTLINFFIILILLPLITDDFYLGERGPISYDPAMETAIIIKIVVIASVVIAIALYWYLYR